MSNFQKHAFLSEGGDREHEGEKNKTNKSGSYSPGRLRNSHSAGSSRHDKRKMDTESDSADNRNTRSKCFDPHVSKEDLLMMGLYRLNDEQEDIYRRFVDMVSTFDEFDRVRLNLYRQIFGFLAFKQRFFLSHGFRQTFSTTQEKMLTMKRSCWRGTEAQSFHHLRMGPQLEQEAIIMIKVTLVAPSQILTQLSRPLCLLTPLLLLLLLLGGHRTSGPAVPAAAVDET